MVVTFPDRDAFAELRRRTEDSSNHGSYLANVKAVLEGRR
jgi:hypothetical protein